MKVVFINSSDLYGGAAIAAWRMHNGLSRYFQTDNSFLVRDKRSSHEYVYRTVNGQYKSFFEKKLSMVLDIFGLQYQFFPFSTSAILNNIQKLKPDIISLHNTHGGYFKTSLVRQLSQHAPVVWTLHDMWSFTGNAAHTFDDDSWKRMKKCRNNKEYPAIGINTGEWLLKQKRRVYQQSDISVVVPSKWLYELASQSPVFFGKEIFQVFNGIDLEVYRPINKKSAREILGIPAKQTVLCFSVASLRDDSWKGGVELIRILSLLNTKLEEPIGIILLGEGDLKGIKEFQNLHFYKMGYVNSDRFMALCLSAADLFIYPTKADNLPNVLVESIACGTPCVTFDIGGCREIISNEKNGFLIPPFNTEYFVKKIIHCIEDNKMKIKLSNNSRMIAEKKFSLKAMTDQYYQIFTKLLSR